MEKTYQRRIVHAVGGSESPALLLLRPGDAWCRVLSWPADSLLGEAPADGCAFGNVLAWTEDSQRQWEQWYAQAVPRPNLRIRFDKTAADGTVAHFVLHAEDHQTTADNSVLVRIENTTAACDLMEKVDSLSHLASVGQVAADVAHEFNNILTAMLGWSQIGQQTVPDNPDALAAFKTIEQNTLRARKIASDLLDVARPHYDVPERVCVGEVLEGALQLLAPELKSAHIQVVKDIAPNACTVLDSAKLTQVFINIIRNALDALPARGTLRIAVTTTLDWIRVIIADSGSGIPEEVLAQVFEPFFSTKIKGDANVHGGSGLGLSICRKIIDALGGSIGIESQRPGGTTVTISLPRISTTGTPGRRESPPEAELPEGLSVLVMDDEPDICEMIHTALSLRGVTVYQAHDGETALRLSQAHTFDAAFLDFAVDGISGHELTAAIIGLQPNLPIAFMSGAEVPPSDQSSHVNFLKKPFDLNEIQAKLQELLAQRP